MQNNALGCCLDILGPRNANVLELHRQANRMIVNLLLCIRNAVNDTTLKIKTHDINTLGNDVPRTRYIRKTPFYWGLKYGTLCLYTSDSLRKILLLKALVRNAVINNNLRLHFGQ